MIRIIVGLIIFFGMVNLLRMAIFIVSNNIYDTRQAHKDNNWKRVLLRGNTVKSAKLLNKLLLRIMRGCRSVMLWLGDEFYEVVPAPLKKPRDRYRPLVSVIVPAYNEAKVLERNLNSIFAGSYSNIEVIIVDDGSTDGTYNRARNYRSKHPDRHMRIIKLKNGGKARALNIAMSRYARGLLVMCLDDDSMLEPDAITNGVKHFKNRRLEALSANVKIIDDGSLLSLIQKFEYLICYEMKKAQTALNIEYIVGGIGSMFRRSALARVNWYDTNTMTEDIDLTMKIINRGNKKHQAAYASDMIAYTECASSVGDLIKQRYRWKYGRLQTFYKNRSMFFSGKKNHYKSLTWVFLPYAIYGEIAFMLEPVVVAFMLIISLLYADTLTFYGAYITITSYIGFNIVGDKHTGGWAKLQMLLIAPTMYLLFFILSFVEYAALVKSIADLPKLKRSLRNVHGSWNHVKRSGVNVTT